MSRQLMGLETEFGFSMAPSGDCRAGRSAALDKMFALLQNSYPHLNGGGSRDVFLACGRFYGEIGEHPEHCTPECTNPWDLVRYTLAGREVMCDLMAQMRREGADATIFTANVDYQTNATWGCHESYLYRNDPVRIRTQIIPHLVSRLIYTGAGGFNSRSCGLEFTLSPRVAHLVRDISSESTNNRAIVHTKDESHCRGNLHRLHLICGESLSSQTSAWLKAGATALVVAMIDNGLDPGLDVELYNPLAAMNTFARDTSLTKTAPLAGWRQMTAIGIQRVYQQMAAENVNAPFMPSWADAVCRDWGAMIGRLDAGGAEAAATTTDWGIKWALYSDLARRAAGVDLGDARGWNFVLERLREALRDNKERSISVERILRSDSPAASEVARLTPYLQARNLTWDNLRPVVDLRTDLHALDTRFGMLGEKGLFNQLDAEGLLDHRVVGVDNIEHAVHNPPRSGRARVRGECIRRLSAQPGRYACTWSFIADTSSAMKLDLSDPFIEGEHWVDTSLENNAPPPREEVA